MEGFLSGVLSYGKDRIIFCCCNKMLSPNFHPYNILSGITLGIRLWEKWCVRWRSYTFRGIIHLRCAGRSASV